jgi:HD superfamily phosphodiesterase
MSTTTRDKTEATSISGVMIPDSKLARQATELVRDTESPLLFKHSTRVYYFGSLAGKRRGLKFDPELLYIGAMFHDMGLTPKYSSRSDRFEVDGANSARAFLRHHNIDQRDIDTVWTAIALHATPGIPQGRAEALRRVSRSLRHSEVKFSEYSYLSFRFVDPDLLGKR